MAAASVDPRSRRQSSPALSDRCCENTDAETFDRCTHAVVASIEKTGHLLIVSEACERGSFPMTLAANLTRFAFPHLKAPPRVLGSPNWIVPGADMEDTFFPQPHDIIDAVMLDLFGDSTHERLGLRTWNDMALAKDAL